MRPMSVLPWPGIDRFQVPHHGGRHNVTTQLLDELLGRRLPVRPAWHICRHDQLC